MSIPVASCVSTNSRVEQIDEHVPPARMQGVLAQLEDRDHRRSSTWACCRRSGLLERSRSVKVHESSWLTLERRPGETLRAGVERTLRDAIRAGALREGVRLPSSRALAQELGVSRGVVTDAYGQLEAQGFLVARARAAPVVAAVARPGRPAPRRSRRGRAPRYDLSRSRPT